MKVILRRATAGIAAVLFTATSCFGATISPLATFGNGDGWRAPNEIVVGDTAGTATGPNYNYLQIGSLERGLAYNPVSGNLILVSRSTAGNGIRVLNGASGADVGFLNQGAGIITGGAFTTNMTAAGGDGVIYVANLQTNVTTGAFKVYSWATEAAAAPTVFFNSTIPGYAGTPRHGDSLDATGSGAGTTLVAGASGVAGYSIINGAAVAQSVPTFVPAGGNTAGDFRLGVTFGATSNVVFGKQTSQNMEVTSYVGAAGASIASSALTSAGEAPMDYAVIAGVPILATIDVNNSIVRIYNVTTPASPVLLTSATTTTGTLTANGNAVGSVKFGAISGSTAVLYAMSTNQGIQAFTLNTIPEPGSLTMLAMSMLTLAGVRRARG